MDNIGNMWLDANAPIVCINVEMVAQSGREVTFCGGAQVVLGHNRALDCQDLNLIFHPSWTGTLDLNGFECMALDAKPNGTSQTAGRVTSSVPGGILNIYQGTAYTNRQVDIAGHAGLTKQGGALFAIDRPLSSTGPLKVKNGTMAFLGQSSWKGCSDVTVEGGTLKIGRSGVFDSKGTIKVTDSGKILLEDGVTQRCLEFYVNGVRQGGGIYGASGDGVTKLDCFDSAGAGKLYVGKVGLAVIVM